MVDIWPQKVLLPVGLTWVSVALSTGGDQVNQAKAPAVSVKDIWSSTQLKTVYCEVLKY